MERKITYFTDKSVFTGKPLKYAHIKVHDELINIRGIKFHMDTVYDTPATDINKPSHYLQPIHSPNYNIHRAFNIYRKKAGLLSPKQIRHARRALHLSQRDASAILGISYSTLSKIENNSMVQSISQDTLLRTLLNRPVTARLIEARLIYIKAKQPAKVQPKKLGRLAKDALK